MALVVASMTVADLVSPPQAATLAPRAYLERDDAPVHGPPPPKEILPDGLAILSALSAPTTTRKLSATFQQLGYDLNRVASGDGGVPRVLLTSFPGDIDKVRETKLRKTVFFKTVLPLVLVVNEEIRAERQRLWRLRYQRDTDQDLDAVDRLWLMTMAEKYDVEDEDIDTLLRRADVIPPSLALAQAAEESGWGTSRFTREGNAIFGEWTFGKKSGLTPERRDEGKTHKVRIFDNLLDSVRAYANNLNTHRAYRELRLERAAMRHRGETLDGHALAAMLTRYSERGPDYVKTLRSIMRVNALRRLDGARLAADRDI
ncbi:MAG: glucosaminidase domain-containing protein [Hyphomicrobiales bacterium]|nr:glucosaminidase domain-containing protein [Hyphomicrobiales bacterium]MCP5372101.1 glucosaminidase domain-containing protein [Hyphomicrobiales bacterium]